MAVERERRSISGIRGTADVLPLEKVVAYAKAYGTFMREIAPGNTIVVGRDTRPLSAQYTQGVIDGLCDAGWDVIDLGIVPSPTVQIAIAKFEAAGGVAVTASHNPVEYHGVKFLRNHAGHGMFLDVQQVNGFFAVYDAGRFDKRRRGKARQVADFAGDFDDPPYTCEYLDRNRIGLPVPNTVILDHHLHRVVRVMGRELDVIRGMNFAVAMDCCGGAGIPIDYVLLDYLYCRLRAVGSVPGMFSRPIEPTPRNLAGLCAELASEERASGSPFDACFVTDCDNDRCVLIAREPDSGAYVPLEEDYTFAIAVDQVLASAPKGSTVVTNWSTSQMLFDIANARHANLRRAPVGEVYTASEALHYAAAVAGEGSCAGVIDPRVGMGRDCLVAIWHVLTALACQRKPLHAIASGLPRYWKVNRDHASSRSVEETKAVLETLQVFYASKPDILHIQRDDGLVVSFTDSSRIHIRSSNTEPILRVRGEARCQSKAEALVDEALRAIHERTA